MILLNQPELIQRTKRNYLNDIKIKGRNKRSQKYYQKYFACSDGILLKLTVYSKKKKKKHRKSPPKNDAAQKWKLRALESFQFFLFFHRFKNGVSKICLAWFGLFG